VEIVDLTASQNDWNKDVTVYTVKYPVKVDYRSGKKRKSENPEP
jgi:hypothetical protein